MGRMMKCTFAASAVVSALIVVYGILYAYAQSNPRIQVPAANRQRFVQMVVLLDGTHSMSDLHFRLAKQIVVTRLVPHVGIGDKFMCYAVGSSFGLENTIAGGSMEEQPPQYEPGRRKEVLGFLREARGTVAPGRVRSQLYNLAGELAAQEPRLQKVRDLWSRQIETTGRPARRGTNLRCAIDAADAYFRASPDQHVEKVLVVVSDLLDDPRLGRNCAGEAPDPRWLKGVRIVLLHPRDSSRNWDDVVDRWRVSFEGRPIEVAPFSAVLNRNDLLRPNPVAGLEKQSVRSLMVNLELLVAPGARLVAIGLIASMALGSVMALVSKPDDKVRDPDRNRPK
jgi:hypothetical protein